MSTLLPKGHGQDDRPTKGAAEHRGRTALLAKLFERILGSGLTAGRRIG
jgi:hypothetical protein